jgi:hypothetical protein
MSSESTAKYRLEVESFATVAKTAVVYSLLCEFGIFMIARRALCDFFKWKPD